MKMISTLALCCAGLITSAVAKDVQMTSAEDAIAKYFLSTPLKKDSKSWIRYTPATINKIDTVMMVDSGATSIIFNKQFAKKNHIKLRSAGSVGGLGDTRAKKYTGKLKSITIANSMNLEGKNYSFVDLGNEGTAKLDGKAVTPAGQLGFNVLHQVDLNIDFGMNRTLLAKKRKVADGLWGILKQAGYTKMDLVQTKNACYVPVKLGDQEGYFLVDTASNQTVVYLKFTEGKNYKILKQSGFAQGVSNKKIPINIVQVNDFSLPGKRLATPMLVIPKKRIVTLSKKPIMGILGIPVMEHTKMILNFKKGEIYLPKRKK